MSNKTPWINDALDALPDWIAIRAGLAPKRPHPVAERMVREDVKLRDMAEDYALVQGLEQNRPLGDDRRKALAAGLKSNAFGFALGKAIATVTGLRYDQQAAEHRAFTAPVPMKNFLSAEFPHADVLDDLPRTPEGAEFKQGDVVTVSGGLHAQLHTYGRKILVSREAIINDDVDLVASVFGNLGAATGRTEGKLVYSMLEDNPALGDGEPMFHTAHGNVVGDPLDASSLGAAMAAMRNQPTPSKNVANLRPAFLIVAADLEYTSLKLIHDIGADIQVIGAPWLAAGRWYLMASPAVSPVVGRLFLESNEGQRPTDVSPARNDTTMDGTPFTVRADTGVVPMGRLGAIRGGA